MSEVIDKKALVLLRYAAFIMVIGYIHINNKGAEKQGVDATDHSVHHIPAHGHEILQVGAANNPLDA